MIRVPQIVLLALCLAACSKEARSLGPSLPQTPPAADDDPRIPAYEGNFFQIAQGGRYFAWYGCAACHGETSPGVLDLADGQWRHGGGFAAVFAAIADRHGRLAYRARVPAEQLWQLTAYVRDLPGHFPEKRRRTDLDQQAEPRAATWFGPQ